MLLNVLILTWLAYFHCDLEIFTYKRVQKLLKYTFFKLQASVLVLILRLQYLNTVEKMNEKNEILLFQIFLAQVLD